MGTIHAWAAEKPGGELKPFEYETGDLGPQEVEIDVEHCGICHSDLSMLDNDWQMTVYPFVGGHEIVGRVSAVGEHVTSVKPGDAVGLGWYSRSCLECRPCIAGDLNLCATAEGTIVQRHGGFADKVRAHSSWVTPIPEGVEFPNAGPLLCGGITVFNPIVENGVLPTHRVGVVGIGGLGHMALAFLEAWGCEVTAFSTSPSKEEEARQLGAHHFVATRDLAALEKVAGSLDMILVTVNVELDWNAYVAALAPRGKLHLVGAAPSVSAQVFPLIVAQRSIGASPLGSPATTRTMLDFAGRHRISPVTEHFPMDRINDAMEHLRAGKPRYRIVLDRS